MLTGWLTCWRSARAASQPRVAPLVPGGVHDGGGGGRGLGQAGHGVGLAVPLAVRAADVELVAGAVAGSGHEDLPDPGAAEGAHRVPLAVPVVEVADDPYPAGIRGPDRERRAGHRPVLLHMRAEHLPQVLVPALADQVQVHLADGGQVAVGIVDDRLREQAPVRGLVADREPVIGHLGPGQRGGEHPGVHMLSGEPGAVREQHGHRPGERPQRADDHAVRSEMRAQDGMRIVVRTCHDTVDLAQAQVGLALLAHRVHASAMEPRGIASQPGRFLASYVTS